MQLKPSLFLSICLLLLTACSKNQTVSDNWRPFAKVSPIALNSLTYANGKFYALSQQSGKVCSLSFNMNLDSNWDCTIPTNTSTIQVTSFGIVANANILYAFGNNNGQIAQFYKYTGGRWSQIGNNPLVASFYGNNQNFVFFNNRLYFAGSNNFCSVGINDSPTTNWSCISNALPYTNPITQIAMDTNSNFYYVIDNPGQTLNMSVIKQPITGELGTTTNQINKYPGGDTSNITVTDNGGEITYAVDSSKPKAAKPASVTAKTGTQVGQTINNISNDSYSDISIVDNIIYVMGDSQIINGQKSYPIYYFNLATKGNKTWHTINYQTRNDQVVGFTVVKHQIFILDDNQIYVSNLP